MRNKTATRNQALQRLLDPRPLRGAARPPRTEEKVLASVPLDVPVTVTASSTKGLEATLSLAEALARHGYVAVPHLAARMIHDRAELVEIRDAPRRGRHHPGLRARRRRRPGRRLPRRLQPARGPRHGWSSRSSRSGSPATPRRHPKITDDLTVQAMWDKRRHATHVVSNLTFDAGAIKAWVGRMRDARHHDAAAARHARPDRPHQAAHHGHQDRGRRVEPVPGQAQGHLRAARRARAA